MVTHDPHKNPVRILQQKLDGEARRQLRERYFAGRIIPLLVIWAALVAGMTAAAAVISIGVALTIYFAGAAVCVMWLSRRARRHSSER